MKEKSKLKEIHRSIKDRPQITQRIPIYNAHSLLATKLYSDNTAINKLMFIRVPGKSVL